MEYSKGFIYTRREAPKDAISVSHKLTVRAGIAHQVSAGHYGMLPLGTKVLQKIENIIREEMEAIGVIEVKLPVMQSAELWQKSGRWNIYGEEMFKLKNRQGREYCLGPTHEELVVELVKSQAQKAKGFPFTLYQFGTKFRDEKRPRGGLLRTKEFIMKDAYSFDYDQAGLDESYQRMRKAYLRILDRIGISAVPIPATAGEMGGQSSEEFLAITPAGEDRFIVLENGTGMKVEDSAESADIQTGIEICHIFKLGTRYTQKLELLTDTSEGLRPIQMGCYGIGVSRILPIIIEQHHDDKGIIWPRSVAPFETTIITIQENDPEVSRIANKIYRELGPSVLYDDRNESPGVKFTDADLIGIPDRLIIGPKGLSRNIIEYERRGGGKRELPLDNIIKAYGQARKEEL